MTPQEQFDLFKQNLGSNSQEVSSPSALYQCMDLAYQAVFVLNFPKATIQNSYAYQVFTLPKEITKQYFEVIPYGKGMKLKVWDLIVWENAFNNVGGHIAVKDKDDDGKDDKFTSLDQNYGSSYPKTVTHTYDHVIGVLRPKVFYADDNILDPTIDIPSEVEAARKLKSYSFYDNHSSINSMNEDHEDLFKENSELLKQIDKNNDDIKKLMQRNAEQAGVISERDKQVTTLTNELNKTKNDLEEETTACTNDKNTLQASLDTANITIENLKKQLADSSKPIKDMTFVEFIVLKLGLHG